MDQNQVDFEGEAYWRARPIGDRRRDWNLQGKDWVEDYRLSAVHPHRSAVVEAVLSLSPLSVLELGCNSGPNLTRLHEADPQVKLYGLEVNQDAVEVARRALPDAAIRRGSILEPLPYEDQSVSVVLADAVLLYISPKEIDQVLDEMTRVAETGIVLVEWQGRGKGQLKDFHWARAYGALLEKRGWQVKKKKITHELWPSEKWAKHGYVYVASKK